MVFMDIRSIFHVNTFPPWAISALHHQHVYSVHPTVFYINVSPLLTFLSTPIASFSTIYFIYLEFLYPNSSLSTIHVTERLYLFLYKKRLRINNVYMSAQWKTDLIRRYYPRNCMMIVYLMSSTHHFPPANIKELLTAKLWNKSGVIQYRSTLYDDGSLSSDLFLNVIYVINQVTSSFDGRCLKSETLLTSFLS